MQFISLVFFLIFFSTYWICIPQRFKSIGVIFEFSHLVNSEKMTLLNSLKFVDINRCFSTLTQPNLAQPISLERIDFILYFEDILNVWYVYHFRMSRSVLHGTTLTCFQCLCKKFRKRSKVIIYPINVWQNFHCIDVIWLHLRISGHMTIYIFEKQWIGPSGHWTWFEDRILGQHQLPNEFKNNKNVM